MVCAEIAVWYLLVWANSRLYVSNVVLSIYACAKRCLWFFYCFASLGIQDTVGALQCHPIIYILSNRLRPTDFSRLKRFLLCFFA